MARTRIFTSRIPGAVFDLYDDAETVVDYHVDGLAQLMSGPTNSKVGLYLVRTVEMHESTPIEVRDVVLKVTIPTRVLLDTCVEILKQMKANEQVILQGMTDERKKVQDSLGLITTLVDKKRSN